MRREYLISDLAEGDRVCIVGGKKGGKVGTVLYVSIDKYLIRLDRTGKVICIRGGKNIMPVSDEDNKRWNRDK